MLIFHLCLEFVNSTSQPISIAVTGGGGTRGSSSSLQQEGGGCLSCRLPHMRTGSLCRASALRLLIYSLAVHNSSLINCSSAKYSPCQRSRQTRAGLWSELQERVNAQERRITWVTCVKTWRGQVMWSLMFACISSPKSALDKNVVLGYIWQSKTWSPFHFLATWWDSL